MFVFVRVCCNAIHLHLCHDCLCSGILYYFCRSNEFNIMCICFFVFLGKGREIPHAVSQCGSHAVCQPKNEWFHLPGEFIFYLMFI